VVRVGVGLAWTIARGSPQLNNLSIRLGDLDRCEDGLAAIEKPTRGEGSIRIDPKTIGRAGRGPDDRARLAGTDRVLVLTRGAPRGLRRELASDAPVRVLVLLELAP